LNDRISVADVENAFAMLPFHLRRCGRRHLERCYPYCPLEYSKPETIEGAWPLLTSGPVAIFGLSFHQVLQAFVVQLAHVARFGFADTGIPDPPIPPDQRV
jgi:hypothetical protein